MNEFLAILSKFNDDQRAALVMALELFAAFERRARANETTNVAAASSTETVDLSLFEN